MDCLVNNLEEEIICDYLVTEKIKKVWNVELNVLESVKLICNKYGLTYYAIAGTLLGAVRHKGYIPWDDDLDIGMPRKDFNRLLEIIDSELPEGLFAQTYRNTRSFPYDMIKVRNSNTTGFTPWEKNENCNKGIFIDVFPIDNCPDDPTIREKENAEIQTLFYKAALLSRTTESSKPFRTLKTVIKWVLRKTGSSRKIWMIEKAIEKCTYHNNTETEYCGMRSFSKPEKFIWKRNSCKTLIEVPFEGTTIIIPSDYDEILSSIYGNYRVFVKADSFHEGATFDPDTPYRDYRY